MIKIKATMTQEHKDLLLKDLCARLPYGVKVSVNQSQLQNYDYKWKNWSFDEEPQEIDGMNIYGVTFGCMDMSDGVIDFEFIKPYLFPLTSMTEEQWDNAPSINLTNFTFESLKCGCFTLASYTCENNLQDLLEFINWLYVNHFDVNGLIPMGLANDATGLNIYEH